jgi:Zn-dependent protease with chaperone function
MKRGLTSTVAAYIGWQTAKQLRAVYGPCVGKVVLDQIFPGSGAITPLAGQLVTSTYSRGEEYAADTHSVVLLRRAGYPKEMMTVRKLP